MTDLAAHRHQTASQISHLSPAEVKEQTVQLLHKKIDYISNGSFEGRNQDVHDETIGIVTEDANCTGDSGDLPAYLKRMCETELLTHEQEAILFREMNYMKFRADKLRSQLTLETADAFTVHEINQLLRKAEKIRDHILQANMRLVISIVKKFVTPLRSFDDMLSDGIMILMQAVERFDFDRGFRFSTYAYRSISRNACRTIAAAQKEEAQFTRDSEEWAFAQRDSCSSLAVDRMWSNVRKIMGSMLENLDRREQFIIRARYALGSHRNSHTFQSLADTLGVSKERVRQLEQRAVSKLQVMAREFDTDDMFAALMV